MPCEWRSRGRSIPTRRTRFTRCVMRGLVITCLLNVGVYTQRPTYCKPTRISNPSPTNWLCILRKGALTRVNARAPAGRKMSLIRMRMSYDPVCESRARAPSRLCQLLCPPNRQMGTFAHSQPHATITTKLFCFSGNVENKTVVFGSAPALGAGGLRVQISHAPTTNS